MPILNYTTQISSHRTVGEIQGILAEAGADSLQIKYDGKDPVSLAFDLVIQEKRLVFRLPARWRGVLHVLQYDPKVPLRLRTEAQARRVAWRILKNWIEAQMAIIEAGLVEMQEVFLPYMVISQGGLTVYEEFMNSQLALPETEA